MRRDQFSNQSVLHSLAPFNNVRALATLLPFRTIEDRSGYHVLIKLKSRLSSSLILTVNFDERQITFALNTQAGRSDAETATLIFQVPLDANLNEIRVQSRQKAYLVSIPKLAPRLRIARSDIIYM